MNSMLLVGLQKILGLTLLSASLILTGCASGMQKTEEGWKFNEEVIQAVKKECTGVFAEASGGTLSALWANKRLILRESRECSRAANLLAEQAENRNKVIGK